MRGLLILAGLAVSAYTYYFVTTLLVYNSDIPETISNYWMSTTQMVWFMLGLLPIAVGHLYLHYRFYKKKEIDMSFIAPSAVFPYMLGVTVQAMIL